MFAGHYSPFTAMRHQSENPFTAISEQLEALASAIDKINTEKATPKPSALPQFITTAEVIKLLHVSRSTLWNWERNKTLAPVRAGRRKLYRVEDISRLLKSGVL